MDCKQRNLRSLKLRDFFSCMERDFNPNSFDNKFISKSQWTPPTESISVNTQRTIIGVSNYINDIVKRRLIRTSRPRIGPFVRCKPFGTANLTPSERQAIGNLNKNTNIIIKPADKGGAIVILDKELYKKEALRQLNNTMYYKPIERSLTPDTVKMINEILAEMKESSFISQKQFSFLKAEIPASPRPFYLLPKVHKERTKWPNPKMPEGRPIVSDCGSETYNIGQFIDYFLKPFATNHASYVKDSFEFVSKIRSLKVPKDCIIVTGDVTALYTNMNIDRSVEAVRNVFKLFPSPHRPDEAILKLLNLVLTRNEFEFNGQLYQQICGTAMGKHFAPNLANIYLLEFDYYAKQGFKIKPLIYLRFIDDIFIIWPGTLQDLLEYQEYLNSLIPGIKISLVPKHQIAEFLDTYVYKEIQNGDTSLHTKVYFKTTDTHQLLHGKSFHPKHTIKGILKSQFIRFKRLCSNKIAFDEACRILYKVLARRGYARSLFRKLKNEVWHSDYELQRKDKNSISKIWPIIFYYDPIGCRIMKHTRTLFCKLNISSHYRIIQCFKIHRNLKNLLIRSRF